MRRSLSFACAALLACAAQVPAHAQGSSVDQHSACMSGRIGTGVASPCRDGSAVYFSPAGLAHTPSAAMINLTLVRSSSEFVYDAPMAPAQSTIHREAEVIPVPAAFLNVRVNPRLAAGIGVFAPYGLGLKWPVCSVEAINSRTCEGENFEGRFSGYDNALRAIYIQPTVAYQVIPGRLSVGAGLDYVLGSIDVHQRVAGPTALGLGDTDIADAYLSGSGSGLTGHIGAMLRVGERTSLGARYLHSVNVDMDGDAEFEQVLTGVTPIDAQIAAQFQGSGPLVSRGIGTEIEFPAQFVAGISHRPLDRLNLMFDYQWTGWESFDAFELDFEGPAVDTLTLNYRNANTFRFAAEYDATDALALRAGFRYNEAATPRATPLLPESERNYYTLGIGYRATSRLTADASFQLLVQPDRYGAVRPEGPRAGVYSGEGQVFSFSLSYRFGGDGQDGM